MIHEGKNNKLDSNQIKNLYSAKKKYSSYEKTSGGLVENVCKTHI
jgi:hypothetical protein